MNIKGVLVKVQLIWCLLMITVLTYAMEEVDPLLPLGVEDVHSMQSHYALDMQQKKGLSSLTLQEWQNGETHELNLSKKELDTIGDFGQYMEKPLMGHIPRVNCMAITTCYFNNNRLTTVPVEAFAALPYLVELNLSHNKLTAADIGAYFRACPLIKKLDLSHNELTDIAWSDHKRWYIESDNTVTLPVIDISHNRVEINEKQRTWLKDRYKEQLNRVSSRAYPCTGLEMVPTFLGMFTGFLTCYLPMMCCAARSTTPFIFYMIPQIGGSTVGAGAGFACVKCGYHAEMEKNINEVRVPLYFNKKSDTNITEPLRLSYLGSTAKICCLCKSNAC